MEKNENTLASITQTPGDTTPQVETDKSYKPYFTVRPVLVTVSKQEFLEFIKSYPEKLELDYYMGHVSYNDWTIAPIWPDSIVAIREVDFEQPEDSWGKIAINMDEVRKSIKEKI